MAVLGAPRILCRKMKLTEQLMNWNTTRGNLYQQGEIRILFRDKKILNKYKTKNNY